MSEPTTQAAPADLTKDGYPLCFGDPSRVCPKDEEGIIQPQVSCVSCEHLRNCLREALKRDGLISDSAGQSYAVSKATDFLKRWSSKKLAQTDKRDHSVQS